MRKFTEYLEQREHENRKEEIAWILASNRVSPYKFLHEYAGLLLWTEQTNPPDPSGDLTGGMQPGQQPNPAAMLKHITGDIKDGEEDDQPAPEDGGKMPQSEAQRLYLQALKALQLIDEKLPDSAKGLVTGLHAQLKTQGQQIVTALSGANEPEGQPQVTDKPIPAGANKGTGGASTDTPGSAPMNVGAAVPTAQG